jgi:hypothetical protein
MRLGPVSVLANALCVFAAFIICEQPALPAFGAEEIYERPAPDGLMQQVLKRLFPSNPFGKSYGLVVGVGQYDDVGTFPSLEAPVQDARRVRDFLRDEAGFDYIVMLTDRDATRGRIDHLMDVDFPNRLHPSDRFLFYFSGHGTTRTLDERTRSRRGYLALTTSHRDGWDEMIGMPQVREWAENLTNVRHVLFLLDACFSGLAGYQPKKPSVREETLKRLALPSSYLITAGDDQEESFTVGDQSVFTQAFLATARGQIAPPPDGIVSLDDMMAGIKRALDAKRVELNEHISMHPILFSERIVDNNGEFFFLTPTTITGLSRTAGVSSTNPEPKAPLNDDPRSGAEKMVIDGDTASVRYRTIGKIVEIYPELGYVVFSVPENELMESAVMGGTAFVRSESGAIVSLQIERRKGNYISATLPSGSGRIINGAEVLVPSD